MQIFDVTITPTMLIMAGIVMVTISGLYQGLQRWKLHYMFQNPMDDLTQAFIEQNPKLKTKLQHVYGNKLTPKHKNLITE